MKRMGAAGDPERAPWAAIGMVRMASRGRESCGRHDAVFPIMTV
jgi:hypothetical protein